MAQSCKGGKNIDNIDLSIIIPCYKSTETLADTLQSVMQQKTAYSYEVIVVFDGDDPSKYDDMLCYDCNDDNLELRIVKMDHHGVAAARNKGLKKARGKYIMFVDADDLLLPGAVSHLLETAETYSASITAGSYLLNGKIIKYAGNNVVVCDNISGRDKLNGFLWGKVFKNDLFRNIRFWEGHYYEDVMLPVVLYQIAKRCVYTPVAVYSYNKCSKGLSSRLHRGSDDAVMDSLLTLEHCYRMLEKNGQWNVNRDYYKYQLSFFLFYIFTVCEKRISNRTNQFQEKFRRKVKSIEHEWFPDICPAFPHVVIENDRLPVVISLNEEYLPIGSVLLQSIIDSNASRRKYQIVIFHNSIRQILIEEFTKKTQNEYLKIQFVDLSTSVSFIDIHSPQMERLSVETYYRLFIPYIIDDAARYTLYLDCDMIVKRDLSDIYRDISKNCVIAACRDLTGIAEYYTPNNRKKTYRDSILKGMNPEDYFIAATILFDLSAYKLEISFSETCYLIIDNKWQQYDQDILNILCIDKTDYLDERWNVIKDFGNNKYLPSELKTIADRAEADPWIVHFGGGSRKPWLKENVPYEELFWKVANETIFFRDTCSRTL